MDCKDCAEKPKGAVPFAAYETELARHDRHVKRLLIVIVICILLLALTNAAWLYAWNQYDYVDETVEQKWKKETDTVAGSAASPHTLIDCRAPHGKSSSTSGFLASATAAY